MKKTRITGCKEIKYFSFRHLKSKKFNDSVVLVFLECCCSIQNLVIRQIEPVSQICVVPFSNFGNWIAFGPLWIRCLLHIWTTLLITVNTFAVVIISLHIRKNDILLPLAWLNNIKFDFTFFLFYSQKGWTAALGCDSVFSLLDSGSSLLSTRSTLLWTAHWQHRITMRQQYRSPQQWTTSDKLNNNEQVTQQLSIFLPLSALNLLYN